METSLETHNPGQETVTIKKEVCDNTDDEETVTSNKRQKLDSDENNETELEKEECLFREANVDIEPTIGCTDEDNIASYVNMSKELPPTTIKIEDSSNENRNLKLDHRSDSLENEEMNEIDQNKLRKLIGLPPSGCFSQRSTRGNANSFMPAASANCREGRHNASGCNGFQKQCLNLLEKILREHEQLNRQIKWMNKQLNKSTSTPSEDIDFSLQFPIQDITQFEYMNEQLKNTDAREKFAVWLYQVAGSTVSDSINQWLKTIFDDRFFTKHMNWSGKLSAKSFASSPKASLKDSEFYSAMLYGLRKAHDQTNLNEITNYIRLYWRKTYNRLYQKESKKNKLEQVECNSIRECQLSADKPVSTESNLMKEN